MTAIPATTAAVLAERRRAQALAYDHLIDLIGADPALAALRNLSLVPQLARAAADLRARDADD